MVDLFFECDPRSLDRLPVDGAHEVIGAVALALLEQRVVLHGGVARAEAGPLEHIVRVPEPIAKLRKREQRETGVGQPAPPISVIDLTSPVADLNLIW